MFQGFKGSWVGHIAAFTAYAIFGFNIIVCKSLTSSALMSPIGIFLLRSVGAGAIFWILSLILPGEKVDRRDMLKIFFAAVLGFFLTQITFLMAIPLITPMESAIMSSLSPIYTMFIAAVALREPITLKKAGGVFISLFGVLYLIVTGFQGTADGGVSNPWGLLLMIANSLSFSLYLGIFRPVIARYSVVTFMKWIFLFSTLMALPLGIGEVATTDFASLPAQWLLELSYLVVMATFVAYFLIPVSQKYIRPTLVSMYSYVQPVLAILISIIAGMEMLTWQKVLAAAAVFGGVVLVSFSPKAHQSASVR